MPDTETVTITTDKGEVTMPWVQAQAVAECINTLEQRGQESVWHPAHCGCCIIVHIAGEDPVTGGYVVGRDGDYGWETTQPA